MTDKKKNNEKEEPFGYDSDKVRKAARADVAHQILHGKLSAEDKMALNLDTDKHIVDLDKGADDVIKARIKRSGGYNKDNLRGGFEKS